MSLEIEDREEELKKRKELKKAKQKAIKEVKNGEKVKKEKESATLAQVTPEDLNTDFNLNTIKIYYASAEESAVNIEVQSKLKTNENLAKKKLELEPFSLGLNKSNNCQSHWRLVLFLLKLSQQFFDSATQPYRKIISWSSPNQNNPQQPKETLRHFQVTQEADLSVLISNN